MLVQTCQPLVSIWLIYIFYGVTTGRRLVDELQDTNSLASKTQPGSALFSSLTWIQVPSALRPIGMIVSPLDRKLDEENDVPGPLRTFKARALTVQTSGAS